MNAKKNKLKDQFASSDLEKTCSEQTSRIFSGVAIHVNGYTKPSSDELKRLMYLHGGTYEHYLKRRQVTHVIATNLPDSKIRELKGLKVVRPEWITDSIKAGRLLSYATYQLYTVPSQLQPDLAKSLSHQGSIMSTMSRPDTPVFSVSHLESITSTMTRSDTSVFSHGSLHSSQNSCNADFSANNECINVTAIDTNFVENLNIDVVQNQTKFEDVPCNDVSPADDSLSMQERIIPSAIIDEDHVQCQASLITNANEPTSFNSKNLGTREVRTTSNIKSSTVTGRSGSLVTEFYNNSRLHYLSTWGAEFRAYVAQLQVKGHDLVGREKLRKTVEQASENRVPKGLSPKLAKVIMHIDMDCFFVSVGLKQRPDLKGKPVAVTHCTGKGMARPIAGSDLEFERAEWDLRRLHSGKKTQQDRTHKMEEFLDEGNIAEHSQVSGPMKQTVEEFTMISMAAIASCSYEAREAGVKNGMLMGSAKKLCPDLVAIPYDFEGYRQVSQQLYDSVASYTNDIEAVSCDELLIDCTDLLADTGASPEQFSSQLRQEIYDNTGCNASAGIGPNILLAKLATRRAKPNGQFHLKTDDVAEFIKGQSIKDIPGVGWSMTRKLTSLKINNCEDLQNVPLSTLQKEFGPKTGQSLYNYSRGHDSRSICVERDRKSVSAEINYGIRFTLDSEAEKFFMELSEEVSSRLQKVQMKGKTVTLKLKVRRPDAPKETAKFLGHGVCNSISKSATLPLPTDQAKIICKECLGILKPLKIEVSDLRGIGIQMQKLESTNIGQGRKSGDQSILNFVAKTTTDVKEVKVHENKPAESPERVALGTPLALELARRKTANKVLPPLPTLPDFSSPDAEKQNKYCTKPREDILLSPSQIDPDVFKELPPDIQEQIRKEMKSTSAKPSNSAGQPGCSHWSREDDVIQEAANHKQDHAIVALPSFSQVDLSCLNALPEEMQQELKAAYAQQTNTNSRDRTISVNSLQLQQAKSPSKGHGSPLKLRSPSKAQGVSAKSKSPSQSNRSSPGFKIPQTRRGRKKKLSPKKLLNQFSQPKRNDTADEKITNVEESDIYAVLPTDVSNDAAISEAEQQQVNLCGAVSIGDVRTLLKEWVASTPDPQEEDIEIMTKYLMNLILDRNLENVDLVLKCINRCVLRHSEKWKQAYQMITDSVQAILLSLYGSQMRLSGTRG